MDFRLTDTATRSPTSCFLCHQTHGPYIDVASISFAQVPTASGLQPMQGAVYICIGNDEQPGCLMSMARLAGWIPHAEHLSKTDELLDRLSEMQAQIDAGPTVVNVVPVDELIERIGA